MRRYSRWIAMAAAGLLFLLAAMPAQAQYFCQKHDKMVALLAEDFRERRLGYGLAGSTMIVEVFVSAGGTWTMLMTDVRGFSCIIAAGDGWEVEVAELGQGA
jgi:hypothetical protein